MPTAASSPAMPNADLPLAVVDPRSREQLRCAAAALDAAELRHQPHEMGQALAALARGYRDLQLWPAAAAQFAAALRWARCAGSIDGVVDLLCEAAETRARQAEALDAEADIGAQPGAARAAREQARDHAFEASQLAERVADARWSITVLLRVSDVLDRCGDRDDALSLQTRAISLMCGAPVEVHDPARLPGTGRLADG